MKLALVVLGSLLLPLMVNATTSKYNNKCGIYFERPRLLPTQSTDQNFAGFTYHIEGELVPALTLDLQMGQSVFFEHHVLFYKHPMVQIAVRRLKGAFKRVIAGMNVFITEASGPGQISFSRDGTGHIFALHLNPGEQIQVREHQFLAASGNIEFTFERVRGVANMLFGNSGFFIDRFQAPPTEPGILWLHGYGNVLEKVLAEGEQIDVEPGAWLYKDTSLKMETNIQSLSTGFFATPVQFVTNRFTGPGRLGLQTMYLHMPTSE